MSQIIVDAETIARLRDCVQPVELIEPTGHVLGVFRPRFNPVDYEGIEPQISEEEIQRRERSDRWHSTEELLARLEKI